MTMIAKEQLKSIVERIERLEEEKQALADDIKEVFAEAKANGFAVKTLRSVIALRKLDASERQEQEALLGLYLQALGMTPMEEFIDKAAKEGMISPEAAAETSRMSDALAERRVTVTAADARRLREAAAKMRGVKT